MITTCNKCGGLIADTGEFYAGRPCDCPPLYHQPPMNLEPQATLAPVTLFGVLPVSEKEKQVLELLKEIEQHCPCGARPETPNTHPHVSGCPVSKAIRLLETPNVPLQASGTDDVKQSGAKTKN